MKKIIHSSIWFATLCLTPLVMLQAAPSAGPAGGMGSDAAIHPLVGKLFGDIKAFSASARMTLKGRMNMVLPMQFMMLDQKVRTEMDMTQMQGGDLPKEMGPQLKTMGMDKVVSIIDPEKKRMLLIYPGMKACAEMEIPPEQAGMMSQDLKIQKTELGKETVEGHPCAKLKYVLTDPAGKKQEATVWTASDLKDFPIQIEFQHEGSNVLLLYQNVKLTPPDASLFSAPADFTKHDSVQAMMQGVIMKMLGQ